MRKALLIFLLMIAPNLFSQDNEAQDVRIVNHHVMMGETVRMLSKKYFVPPSEIYRLNKFAVDGISQGMTLRIPVPVKDEPVKSVEQSDAVAETAPETPSDASADNAVPAEMVSHIVASGETLSGLARQYGVTVQALKDANPKVAKRGLRADETIKIPASGGIVPPNENASVERLGESTQSGTANPDSGGTITHIVTAGETLSGLARKYNVSVDVIKQQNPRVAKKGLQSGQVLKITAE